MARDTAAAAGQNSKSAQGLSQTYGDRASSTYNILTPTLNKMATNPQGFGSQTMANMTTAAKQSIGGANSGIVGQADLAAARTNNAGAFAPMATQAGHDATAQLSDAALGIQNRDALLKEQQRQEGISGLEGLYSANTGAGENALGLSNQSLQTQNEARQNGWLQNMTGIISAVNGNGAGTAAAIGKYCWIAAELYGGWDDPRTLTVRAWLGSQQGLISRALLSLYSRFGERIAEKIKTNRSLRKLFAGLFDRLLERAGNDGY